MKKKNGFTLIELLAVIVILAIIMLVAGTNVFDILGDAEKSSFRNEFLALLDAAQTRASIDMLDGVINGSNRTKCYTATDLKFDTKGKNYTYCAEVKYEIDGTLTVTGWMSSNKYKIVAKNNTLTRENVLPTSGEQVNTNCTGTDESP